MEKSAVVIYAAGIGSRMKNITDYTSKCILDLGGITPLEHTIRSFVNCGITNVILVIGYYADRVRKTVTEFLKLKHICANVTFIMNDKYDYHGCEYSIACAWEAILPYETVYITEGDMLLDSEDVRVLVESGCESGVLIRDVSYIDPKKSVVACAGQDGKIRRFAYDDTHQSVLDCMPKGMKAAGDSLQMWKFGGSALNRLREAYAEYYFVARKAKQPMKENGLVYINQVCGQHPIEPVSAKGSRCINLNTAADIEMARGASWLNR